MSSTRVAVALALLAGAMSVAALLVVGDWSDAPDLPVDIAIGLSYSAAAVLVLAGTGGRRIGWLLLGIGLCGAVAGLAAALSLDGIGDWIWVGGFLPLLTLVPLLYPDGRLPGARWRPWVVTSVAGMALLAVGSATYPGDVAEVVFLTGAAVLVPSCLAGAAALVVRWRRADGLVRRQVQVLLVPAGLLLLDTVLQGWLPWPANALTQAAATALVPVAIGVAVTRHRLYDLDLAVCRAVGGLSLAVCLAAIYVSLFLLVAAVLPGGPTVAAATAAAVCGLLLHPLGVRLTRGVDRMFYGDRADPARVLEATAAALRDDLGEVPERVCAVLVESLRLGSATIVVGVAEPGLPLTHRGEVVGTLLVTPRAGEAGLSSRDADLLAVVCDQVAPAVAALRLSDRLQHSRAALVTAREEERRRLRRDLHDGVGAALAGVRLQVETARDLVTDPVAGGLLHSAAAGVATAVDDVRAITDDLRPAVLDDLGLGAGLRGLADRMATPGTGIDVTVDLDGQLPAAVEVACYRIAAEALANAVRHARARRVAVHLDGTPDWVSLRVEDDGAGLPESPRAGGLGLASMRQRAEEIGGRLTVTSTAAGTVVRADLPLEAR
ncbi:ATP-binding protein [Nocardioides sp. SR21]|uniref:GAF domain-containing sensor histidine kinase n=1 Tax=Nocardioides sp. SR21 TaxID=2919501 RepID=UPI001FAA1F86|nr:ATP-binding protein [Nocardioides sp. SR21]